jgi:chromosome partitioning protein
MRTICIINQKGGVAKTTTAVSVAAGLARAGKQVLLVDMDPQGNIAHSLETNARYDLYHFLTGQCSHLDCTVSLGTGLEVITSTDSLTKLNTDLNKQKNPLGVVKEKFGQITGYDYVIFDCAPSLGMLNQNVMLFAREAIIPVSTTYLSLTGLTYMKEAIDEINNHFGHELKITHIVPTMHDARNRTNKSMHSKLKEDYGDLVTNPIRINAKLAEAPASGKSIFGYDPRSRGAKDYGELVETVLKGEEHLKKQASSPISARVQRMMADVQIED